MTRPYNLIIHGGRYFDGTGAPSAIRTIGIRDGHVAMVSRDPLNASACSMGSVLPGISTQSQNIFAHDVAGTSSLVCDQFMAGRNTFATIFGARYKSAFVVSVG